MTDVGVNGLRLKRIENSGTPQPFAVIDNNATPEPDCQSQLNPNGPSSCDIVPRRVDGGQLAQERPRPRATMLFDEEGKDSIEQLCREGFDHDGRFE